MKKTFLHRSYQSTMQHYVHSFVMTHRQKTSTQMETDDKIPQRIFGPNKMGDSLDDSHRSSLIDNTGKYADLN
jgi:hypothetical protein